VLGWNADALHRLMRLGSAQAAHILAIVAREPCCPDLVAGIDMCAQGGSQAELIVGMRDHEKHARASVVGISSHATKLPRRA